MKFGFNQIGEQPPKWIVKINDILIMFIMPAFALWVLTIPERVLDAEMKNFAGATATFGVALLKGLQYLTGQTQIEKKYGNEG